MEYTELKLNWKQKAISEIDFIIASILKTDKWDRYANQLSNLLLTNVTDKQKEAINDVIRFLKAGDGDILETEVEEMLNLLEGKLGKPLTEAMREPVTKYQLLSYRNAQKELGIQFQFNQMDIKALRWLEEDQMYWIGDHYDSQLREKLREITGEILAEGLSRDKTANLLQKQFGDQFNRSNYYWEGLADHIITRSREFGRVEGYVKANVVSLKIVAVLDSRTSKICRYMHGRIIKVNDAVNLRNKLMNAESPEDVKKISPWLNERVVENKVKGKSTSYVVSKLKQVIPPFHFKCRTRTVVAYDDEVEELNED